MCRHGRQGHFIENIRGNFSKEFRVNIFHNERLFWLFNVNVGCYIFVSLWTVTKSNSITMYIKHTVYTKFKSINGYPGWRIWVSREWLLKEYYEIVNEARPLSEFPPHMIICFQKCIPYHKTIDTMQDPYYLALSVLLPGLV